MEKDYSLLRPFDLEAASKKSPICWPCQGVEILFVGMASDNKAVIEYVAERQVQKMWPSDLRMSPLAWVEGKPVYRGDVLYYKHQDAEKFVVDRAESNSFCGTAIYSTRGTWLDPNTATWQKPKTKREGWVNILPPCNTPFPYGYIYTSEQQAKESAPDYTIATAYISWEE